MVKILLTSTGLQTSAVQDAFVRLLPQPSEAVRAVVVTTASVQWKERNKHAVRLRDYLNTLGLAHSDFLDVENESAECLRDYNAICLNGGNPFYLLHHLRNSGADQILKQLTDSPVLLVGISAGAVVLGPSISVVKEFDADLGTYGVTDYAGLGLIEFAVMPHLNRWNGKAGFSEHFQRFQADSTYPVIGIGDDQAVLVSNGNISWITGQPSF